MWGLFPRWLQCRAGSVTGIWQQTNGLCVCVFRQNTKKSSVRAQKKRVRVKEMLTDTQTCSISAHLRFLDTDVWYRTSSHLVGGAMAAQTKDNKPSHAQRGLHVTGKQMTGMYLCDLPQLKIFFLFSYFVFYFVEKKQSLSHPSPVFSLAERWGFVYTKQTWWHRIFSSVQK